MDYLEWFNEPDREWREKDTDFDAIRKKYEHVTGEELDAMFEQFKQEVLRRRAMEKKEE